LGHGSTRSNELDEDEQLLEKQTLNNGVTQLNSWQAVDWQAVEATVTRIREQIYVASAQNNLKKVGSLQKLMLRSRANWLQSIRRVTQINSGRKTPGIDREVVLDGKGRLALLSWLTSTPLKDYTPPPVRRVYIPKKNGQKRPLGMPTIRDRVMQAIVKNALEPYWEARFEHYSFGFRPGRSAHDAIASIHNSLARGKRGWILDADIKGAFDNIDHDALMSKIGNCPARNLSRKWLKAGVMENLEFSPGITGTPQGGIISPLLANIALHGMETAAGVKTRYVPSFDRYTQDRSPVKLVRYADDLVVMCYTEQDAKDAQAKLEDWLSSIGLEMSKEKTSIVHIDEGFDFLGFNIRRYSRQSRKKSGFVVQTRPSKKSIKAVTNKIRDCFQAGKSQTSAILRANSIIRGWSNYFRIGVSYKTFQTLDNIKWHRTWRYAKRRHPKKSASWLYNRYFKRIGTRKWVFYDHKRGLSLKLFSNTPIVRHTRVKYGASPDNPALRTYWSNRRAKAPASLVSEKQKLWSKQNGICPVCTQSLDTGEELEVHHLLGRGHEALRDKRLLHHTCHVQVTKVGLEPYA